MIWAKYNWKNTDFWESFQDNFKGFTEEDFKLVNNSDIWKLCNYLRRQKVWIEKSKLTIAKSLFNALQEEKPTQWIDTEIQEYLSIEGAFDLYWINFRLKKTLIVLSLGIVSFTILPSIPLSISAIIKLTSLISNILINNPPPAISNSQIPASQGYGRELANLAKIYTDEAKYSDKNNSFSFKLIIFHDICARANVPQEILLKTFPIMLTGLTLDYYYLNTSISTIGTFDKICNLIQTYFEGAKYRRSVLSR